MASFKARIGCKRQKKMKVIIVVLFRSYPTRNRKFQKNSKKNSKKLKNTIMAPFQATIG